MFFGLTCSSSWVGSGPYADRNRHQGHTWTRCHRWVDFRLSGKRRRLSLRLSWTASFGPLISLKHCAQSCWDWQLRRGFLSIGRQGRWCCREPTESYLDLWPRFRKLRRSGHRYPFYQEGCSGIGVGGLAFGSQNRHGSQRSSDHPGYLRPPCGRDHGFGRDPPL